MIGKLARKLGFQQSVPVSLIDDWVLPSPDQPVVELAPRDGASSCFVDQYGRIQVRDGDWTLELTLAAGARWLPVSSSPKVKQQLIAPGVLETTITTPSGPVVQRVAAAVVDSQPALIVEIENAGGVAIAAGVVARPLRQDGRGFIGEIEVGASGISIDGQSAVRFDSGPAAVKAFAGADGDLLQVMPDASDGTREASAKCRSGGAQAGAVWPLPHTATLRLVVELAGPTSASAGVPSTADVNRGWEAHLKQGLRVEIDGLTLDEDVAIAARSLLTLWPEPDDAAAAIVALSEMGFSRDAGRFFAELERADDDAGVVRALARWAQLGEPTQQLEDLDLTLARLARAAHVVANSGGVLAGPAWLESALIALGGRLHQIDQPDVGDRIHNFQTTRSQRDESKVSALAGDRLALLTKARDKRGLWSNDQMGSAARLVQTARSILIDDAGSELRLLPEVPLAWRGRAIDVFGVPVANGNVSFGLRWHGPRPAVFWEANLAPEAPVRFTVPGIDPAFESTERQGETLLADPGWQAP